MAAGTSDFAGTLGKTGAIIERWVGPASSCTGTCTFAGTVTVFGPAGSYGGTITSGTIDGANEQGPPSEETMAVTVKTGSGLYAHAKGTLTVTNTYIAGSPGTDAIAVKGTIKY